MWIQNPLVLHVGNLAARDSGAPCTAILRHSPRGPVMIMNVLCWGGHWNDAINWKFAMSKGESVNHGRRAFSRLRESREDCSANLGNQRKTFQPVQGSKGANMFQYCNYVKLSGTVRQKLTVKRDWHSALFGAYSASPIRYWYLEWYLCKLISQELHLVIDPWREISREMSG